MKSFIGKLGALAAMSAMITATDNTFDDGSINSKPVNEISPSLHNKIPKGCKKWYINEYGDAYTTEPLVPLFTCYALNKKSALRKYKNYLKS